MPLLRIKPLLRNSSRLVRNLSWAAPAPKAWDGLGRGPLFAQPRQAPVKRGGRRTDPAALFLDTYGAEPPVATKLPYPDHALPLRCQHPRSCRYNKTVDIRKVRRLVCGSEAQRLAHLGSRDAQQPGQPVKDAGTWITSSRFSKTLPRKGTAAPAGLH